MFPLEEAGASVVLLEHRDVGLLVEESGLIREDERPLDGREFAIDLGVAVRPSLFGNFAFGPVRVLVRHRLAYNDVILALALVNVTADERRRNFGEAIPAA